MNRPQPVTSAREIAAALEKEISPDQVAKVLRDALSATTLSRSGAVEVDTRSRLQAAALVLSYQVGTPVQRSESVNVNLDADSAVGLKQRLAHSPALRKVLQGMLDEVEKSGPTIEASSE